MKQVPLFINGEWVISKSTRLIDVTNPATQEVIAQVPCATMDEMQKAISSAKETFKVWKDKPIIQQQLRKWNLKKIEEMLFKIAETEILMKKNSYIKNNVIIKDLIIKLTNKASTSY